MIVSAIFVFFRLILQIVKISWFMQRTAIKIVLHNCIRCFNLKPSFSNWYLIFLLKKIVCCIIKIVFFNDWSSSVNFFVLHSLANVVVLSERICVMLYCKLYFLSIFLSISRSLPMLKQNHEYLEHPL